MRSELHEPATFAAFNRRNAAEPGADYGVFDQAVTAWMEREQRARVLVDDGLRVLWMSASAGKLMSGPNSLLIRNGHIRTRENRFDQQLRELIHGARARTSTCCLHDAKTNEHLVLTALRLSASPDDMVGLSLLRASDDFPFDLADLHSAFGFTQTEARVAYCLMGGRTAGETADDLGVSLETVRTHIKRAYAKLGVSSREGFFRRLTPFLIPLV